MRSLSIVLLLLGAALAGYGSFLIDHRERGGWPIGFLGAGLVATGFALLVSFL